MQLIAARLTGGDGCYIGLGDLTGEDWGMGSWGRLNMSAKALHRSCIALVVVLPLLQSTN